MATVGCEECGAVYDDTYRRTYCPHDYFEMRTTVCRGDGEVRVCTTVEEVKSFLGEES
jgi:uncharacterized OB-fold protein